MAATATHRPGRQGKLVTYERDIVCLPMWFAKEGDLIKIPRKKPVRRFLAVNKLLGKIQLRSTMGEAEIFEEIRSVFRAQWAVTTGFHLRCYSHLEVIVGA